MTFQNEQIDKTSGTLTRTNWICMGAMIVLLLITSFVQKITSIAASPTAAAKLYFAAIVIAFITIPLTSWLFNKRVKQISSNDPTELSLRVYRVAFFRKLIVVCSAFIVNLTLYFFSNNTHLLIVGAIYIVYQMIALPSKEGLFEIVGIELDKENVEQAL